MVFLFSDTQIKNETFVEDINNMLNSGEVSEYIIDSLCDHQSVIAYDLFVHHSAVRYLIFSLMTRKRPSARLPDLLLGQSMAKEQLI